MLDCYFVNCDNIDEFKKEHQPKVAVIARPDEFLKKNKYKQIIIETDYGVFTRCYLCKYDGVKFIIVYGRHEKQKKTSLDIDYNLTQEALSLLGIQTLIGTFVVGCTKETDQAGDVYILDNYIGLASYNNSFRPIDNYNFHNKDMFEPFDEQLRNALIQASKKVDFVCKTEGVYGCLVGYPRLETKSEYKFFQNIGCDVVGKTLDPEVTIATMAGCKYAGIAVTIDDTNTRKLMVEHPEKSIEMLSELITSGRRKTFELFLLALKSIASYANGLHNEVNFVRRDKSNFFYCRPNL